MRSSWRQAQRHSRWRRDLGELVQKVERALNDHYRSELGAPLEQEIELIEAELEECELEDDPRSDLKERAEGLREQLRELEDTDLEDPQLPDVLRALALSVFARFESAVAAVLESRRENTELRVKDIHGFSNYSQYRVYLEKVLLVPVKGFPKWHKDLVSAYQLRMFAHTGGWITDEKGEKAAARLADKGVSVTADESGGRWIGFSSESIDWLSKTLDQWRWELGELICTHKDHKWEPWDESMPLFGAFRTCSTCDEVEERARR
jgi:hypothetical protein